MTELSYTHGNDGLPLIGETIGTFLDRVAAERGDAEALVVPHQNIRWTYSDLRQQAEWLASGLLDVGIEPGDRVGIWAPNCAEWTATQFATAKAGIILVNINPAYRTAELEHALKAVGCKALIAAAKFKSSDYITMLAEVIGTAARDNGKIVSDRVPQLKSVITLGGVQHGDFMTYETLIERGKRAGTGALARVEGTVRIDDAVNIQFTSGTTGLPKGATLSHHNLLNNAQYVGEATDIRTGDRVCIPVPLYHCFGMVMGSLACLTRGACMVYPSEAFDPTQTLATIEAEQCTQVYGVPTMFIAMLGDAAFPSFDLSSLRGGIMAGAPCPAEVMKQVISAMHMSDVTIAYGMTETSPVSFQTRLSDPLDKRVETVGRIMPHLEVKVVDEQGQIVPRGDPGELCTRGYSVMIGYWGDEARTRDVLDEAGWMHTGDLATLDDEGYCRIVGRIKDMVIRGGENLYPREIEEYLYRHPDIRDVQVIGVPDEKYGEELCAWIIARDGSGLDEASVRAFCQGQIAHYKIPRHIRFVESFPTTVTGKIQKYKMREAMLRGAEDEPVL